MKTAPIQTELLSDPTSLHVESLRGPQLLTRLPELKAQGMIVLRMKCGPGNADYEVEWRSDWTNAASGTAE